MDDKRAVQPVTSVLDELIQQDQEKKRRRQAEYKEATLREYIAMLEKDRTLAQNSPSRLLEIVVGHGVEELKEEERWLGWVEMEGTDSPQRYGLFTSKLFGLERPTAQFVHFVSQGAKRLSTGKQIILLVGPPASGKSTFAMIIKKALEAYNKPVYQIKGCPLHEEPLHVLPRYMREQIAKRPEECSECRGSDKPKHLHLGIKIEGDLCPVCRYMLETPTPKGEKDPVGYKDPDGTIRWWDVLLTPFTFSIQGARGIGSFEPSEEKSQDVTQLVGKENIAISSTKGPDHPLAYSLTGELEKANRGIFEGRELIKSKEEIMWTFISVAEEKEIKVQGSTFPHISIDTVVIGHTNLNEFKRFAANQANEALHDRIYVIHFPYPLRVQDEVRVYDKLIMEESDFAKLKGEHIACPGALDFAARFAIGTRLVPSNMGVDVMTKMKVYNGEMIINDPKDKGRKPIDVQELVKEGQASDDMAKKEGMFGVSSRDVLAALNTALVQHEKGCLTPLRAIQALREVFEHRMGYDPEEVRRFQELLSAGEGGSIMAEYRKWVLEEVNAAFLNAYGDLAKNILAEYIQEIKLWRELHRKFIKGDIRAIPRDPATGKPREPNEKLMKSVEAWIGISESEAGTFRGEILEYMASHPDFDYETYPPLRVAVQRKLLGENQGLLTAVLATDRPKDEETKKRAKDLFDALRERGFCDEGIKELLRQAREYTQG